MLLAVPIIRTFGNHCLESLGDIYYLTADLFAWWLSTPFHPSQYYPQLFPILCRVRGLEAVGTIFLVFGMTRPGFEPTTSHMKSAHSTSEPVCGMILLGILNIG